MERIDKIKAARKVLAEYKYEPTEIIRGYNNRTLYVNIETLEIKEKVVTDFMKEKFTGGKGFDLYYLWDAVKDDTKWNDPENEIVISPGPLGGITQYPGAGKSLVCTISPLTGLPIDSNVGGYFGPYLKFSGFDAIEIQGNSKEEVIVFIDGNAHTITIEAAPEDAIDAHVISEEMADLYAEDDDDKMNISVVSSGRAAKISNIGVLNFSFWDKRRNCARLKQAGRGGVGRVFRNKNIKALVVRYRGTHGDLNNPYDKSKLNTAGLRLHREMKHNDDFQCMMRRSGTAHVTDIMNDYDLLPTMNYQYGSHPEVEKLSCYLFEQLYLMQKVPDGCWYGCSMSCAKAASDFVCRTGPYKGDKVCVDGPEYENAAGLGSNCGVFDPRWVLEANFYCDTYGLDTISMGTMTAFAMECFQRGLYNLDDTEGLDMRWGNGAALNELMHQMVNEAGFGMLVGKGVREMKRIFAERFGKPAPEYEHMLKGRKWSTMEPPQEKLIPTYEFNPDLLECPYLKEIEYDDAKVMEEIAGTPLACPGANNREAFLGKPERWEKIEGIPTISRDEIADYPVGKPYYCDDPLCPYTNGRPWIKMTAEQIALMQDIGMENKGMEYSEYLAKESLAQQGGFALCNKGPQHDEAWLIFMDMVNGQIPTFEDKANALHYFPMIRTWFGLHGLCKLPWNDVEPVDNYKQKNANRVPEHMKNYFDIVEGVTGIRLDEDSLVAQSERVYTFQRIFDLRRNQPTGAGTRKGDQPPYRAVGPVTEEEYLSREDRYDTQMKEKIGVDPAGKSVAEKIAITREYRLNQYRQLVDAVYERRGWTPNGIVKLEKLIALGMDLPQLVRVIRPYLKEEGYWPTGPEYAKYETM
ncbi:MAG: aldehyde ferredoxin oxidoreductase C-terminal domain-containing protein [Bacillota bacterium]|nr:aldehyde ferredoxin oxidoreductase C-terminal domain-containing protein [Bacillota bacterium]